MAKRCGTRNGNCHKPRANWWKQALGVDWFNHNTGGGEPVYSPEAQAVFDIMPDSIPVPLKNAMATFVDTCVADGNWSLLHDFVYLGLNTAPNSQKGWKGVANATVTLADHNPYSDYQVRLFGTGSRILTGITPSVIGSLNNFGFGIYIKDHRRPNTALFGAISGTARLELFEAAGTQLRFSINTNGITNDTTETSFSNYSHYAVERTAAAQSCIVKNGVKFSNKTIASTALPTTEISIFGINQDGTHSSIDVGRARCYYAYRPVGFDVAKFNTALQALNQDIDDLIPYIMLVYETLGQSNSIGQAENSRRLGLTTYTTNPPAMIFTKARNMTLNGSWDHMRIGANNQGAGEASTTNFGFEGSLPKLLYDRIPYASIRIIKTGVGGTVLGVNPGGNDWMPPPTSVNEWFDISTQAMFADAVSKLQTEYPGKDIKVVIVSQQGENDSLDATRTANYASNLATFVAAMRAFHPLLADAPWIATRLDYHRSVNEGTINTAYANFAASNPNFYLLNVAPQVAHSQKQELPADVKSAFPPTTTDDQHNSYEFQIKKGEMIYDKLVEIGYI